jgi:hypothetical protein
MPEPITRTTSNAVPPRPRQHDRSGGPLLRHLREQDWRTLVGTYRLLSRLAVERSKHHQVDEADDYARQARAVEEELERLFALRWARRRPDLLLEQACWWGESHEEDPLSCRFCQLQQGDTAERRSPWPLRRDWE